MTYPGRFVNTIFFKFTWASFKTEPIGNIQQIIVKNLTPDKMMRNILHWITVEWSSSHNILKNLINMSYLATLSNERNFVFQNKLENLICEIFGVDICSCFLDKLITTLAQPHYPFISKYKHKSTLKNQYVQEKKQNSPALMKDKKTSTTNIFQPKIKNVFLVPGSSLLKSKQPDGYMGTLTLGKGEADKLKVPPLILINKNVRHNITRESKQTKSKLDLPHTITSSSHESLSNNLQEAEAGKAKIQIPPLVPIQKRSFVSFKMEETDSNFLPQCLPVLNKDSKETSAYYMKSIKEEEKNEATVLPTMKNKVLEELSFSVGNIEGSSKSVNTLPKKRSRKYSEMSIAQQQMSNTKRRRRHTQDKGSSKNKHSEMVVESDTQCSWIVLQRNVNMENIPPTKKI